MRQALIERQAVSPAFGNSGCAYLSGANGGMQLPSSSTDAAALLAPLRQAARDALCGHPAAE